MHTAIWSGLALAFFVGGLSASRMRGTLRLLAWLITLGGAILTVTVIVMLGDIALPFTNRVLNKDLVVEMAEYVSLQIVIFMASVGPMSQALASDLKAFVVTISEENVNWLGSVICGGILLLLFGTLYKKDPSGKLNSTPTIVALLFAGGILYIFGSIGFSMFYLWEEATLSWWGMLLILFGALLAFGTLVLAEFIKSKIGNHGQKVVGVLALFGTSLVTLGLVIIVVPWTASPRTLPKLFLAIVVALVGGALMGFGYMRKNNVRQHMIFTIVGAYILSFGIGLLAAA